MFEKGTPRVSERCSLRKASKQGCNDGIIDKDRATRHQRRMQTTIKLHWRLRANAHLPRVPERRVVIANIR